jgi:hypothetical protein
MGSFTVFTKVPAPVSTAPKVFIPQPQSFNIVYQKRNGVVDNYRITPISVQPTYITAYANGHGVRTFRRESILSIAN